MRSLLFAIALSLPQAAHAQLPYFRPIRVVVPPPAIRVEAQPLAPSPRHQWMPGYWAWRGNAHVWMGGRWAMPPAPGYVWEPARWENVNGAWMFYEGHWRVTDQPDPGQAYQPPPPPVQDVVVEAPPPAPLEEVRPAVPFEGAVWVPGYWNWYGGTHVWVAGRWSARPAGFNWDHHRWEHRPDGRWVQHPGHWHHH